MNRALLLLLVHASMLAWLVGRTFAADPDVASPLVSFQYLDSLTEASSEPSVVSSVVSYQYFDSVAETPDTPNVVSPLVSYQYYEWPGDENLTFESSAVVSYFYQIGIAGPDVAPHGCVCDEMGAPVMDATISASILDLPGITTRSAPDGSYRLPSLTPGIYVLTAAKPAFAADKRVVALAPTSAQQDFRIRLLPALPDVRVAGTTPPVLPPNPLQGPDPLEGAKLLIFDGTEFVENVQGLKDRAKMSIVMTHGWKSDPNAWAKPMAGLMTARGIGQVANIFAWGWRNAVNPQIWPPSLNLTAEKCPRHGTALGARLYSELSADQGLHLIGHSLGTLVQRYAADYLHERGWDANKTHLTIFDEAEAVQALDLLVLLATDSVLRQEPNPFAWGDPIPAKAKWIDNYVSQFGFPHSKALNVCLQKGIQTATVLDPFAPHRYPMDWYDGTIGKLIDLNNDTALGIRRSFEHNLLPGRIPLTFPPPDFPVGEAYHQKPDATDWLEVEPLPSQNVLQCIFPELGLPVDLVLDVSVTAADYVVDRTVSAAVKVGQISVEVGERVGSGILYGVNTLVEGVVEARQGIVDLFNRPEVRINLLTGPALAVGFRPAALTPGGEATNSPAYVWLPIAVPANAAALVFDCTVHGDGGEDALVFGINGSNLFTLEIKFLPDGELAMSRLIDVSSYAGTTNEFFFGILGGTSTNCAVQVAGIRFYSLAAPISPAINGHPVSQTVSAGSNVSFTVTASGAGPISYQWRLNGTNLFETANVRGTTTATLALASVQAIDAGIYSVEVNNPYGAAISSNATLTVQNPGPRCLVHFDFNEVSGTVALDSSGNSNHGVLLNGPLRTNGVVGRALRFDGSNDRVVATNANALNTTGAVTVACWIQPMSLSSSRYFLIKGRVSSSGYSYALRNSSARVQYRWISPSGSQNTYQTTTNVLAVNRWTHVAAVHTPGSAPQIFINGVSVPVSLSSGSATALRRTSSYPFSVGASSDGSDAFPGFIDEVFVCPGALTALQVQSLTNGVPPGPPPPPTPLAITTPSPLAGGRVGLAYSQTLMATGGTPGYSWTNISGALPPGLTLNTSSGVISGTPTAAGLTGFRTRVRDSAGQTREQDFTLTVTNPPPPVIATASPLPGGTVGVAYSVTLAASNGLPPFGWSVVSGQPAWLTLNLDTGVLSGTPQAATTNEFRVRVTDFLGQTHERDFTLVILAVPPAPPCLLQWKFEETSGATALDSSGNGNDGTLVNMPTRTNSQTGFGRALWFNGSNARVVAINANSLNVTGALTVACWVRPESVSGSRYLLIKGSSSSSAYAYGLRASDAAIQYRWVSPGGSENKFKTTADVLVNGRWTHLAVVHTPGSQPVIYINGAPAPGGLSSGSASALRGTSANPFTVGSSSDGSGLFLGAIDEVIVCPGALNATQIRSLTNGLPPGPPPPLGISTASRLPGGQVNAAYSLSLMATGGTPGFTWTVAGGVLPAGLTLNTNTGAISGTPATAGSTVFRARVRDSAGQASEQDFTLTITNPPPPVIATASPLPGGTVGVAYSVPLAASNGLSPFGWSVVSGQPAWLTLNLDTGVLSGTPPAAITNEFRVRVTDFLGQMHEKDFTLVILAVPPAPPCLVQWKFDEASGATALDSSGNGNNGTLVNMPTRTNSQAGFGRAVWFDGSNDRVVAINANSLNVTGALTVACWARPESVSGSRYLLIKGSSSSSAYAYGLRASDAAIQYRWVSPGGSENKFKTTSDVLTSGQWTHVAAVHIPGSQPVIYINGAPAPGSISSGSASALRSTSVNPFTVGSSSDGSDLFLGAIDEVFVCGRALTPTDIRNLMVPSAGGSPPMAPTPLPPSLEIVTAILVQLRVADDVATLSWIAEPGAIYRVQYKDNLEDTVWQELPDAVIADDTEVSVEDILDWQAQRFYRVLREP